MLLNSKFWIKIHSKILLIDTGCSVKTGDNVIIFYDKKHSACFCEKLVDEKDIPYVFGKVIYDGFVYMPNH